MTDKREGHDHPGATYREQKLVEAERDLVYDFAKKHIADREGLRRVNVWDVVEEVGPPITKLPTAKDTILAVMSAEDFTKQWTLTTDFRDVVLSAIDDTVADRAAALEEQYRRKVNTPKKKTLPRKATSGKKKRPKARTTKKTIAKKKTGTAKTVMLVSA